MNYIPLEDIVDDYLFSPSECNYKREAFDEVVSKLLALVPEGDEEGKYSDKFRAGLLDALFDANQGEYVSLGGLKKGLGL